MRVAARRPRHLAFRVVRDLRPPVPGGHGPAAAVASVDGNPYRMVRAESLRRQPFPLSICIHGGAPD